MIPALRAPSPPSTQPRERLFPRDTRIVTVPRPLLAPSELLPKAEIVFGEHARREAESADVVARGHITGERLGSRRLSHGMKIPRALAGVTRVAVRPPPTPTGGSS